MQYTTNYNLKKPEGSDPVNIQDFNDNADSLDTELKKRVIAAGGDISNTKIVTADSIATEFPVPAAGDTPKTFLGKMKKFVEDFKNIKTGLLTVGMLVNNCVTNNANLPLSAAQGKVLMDLYTQLNGDNFSTYRSFIGLDFNTIEKTGIYSDGSTPDTSGCKNYPVNITGLLFVLRTQYVCAQIYFTNDMTSLHVRARYLSNVWSGWRAFSLA